MGGIYGRAFQKAKVLQRMKDSLGPLFNQFFFQKANQVHGGGEG
jgi:hypothetical protein